MLRLAIFVTLAWSCSSIAAGEELADAIRAYLQPCLESTTATIGIVVGMVDEQGSRIVACGQLDKESGQEFNGDTVFEIGSDTKTFTAILLQDMVERGKMKLDDPVAHYLPESIKMPARNGKQITLRHLATHTSGLPGVPDNLDAKRASNPYADYTVDKLYAFLSSYELPRDPGATSEYSNLGMGLLGHVIGLQAGESYEVLVVDRICRPLGMDSTRITLGPELMSRLAQGHNDFGEPVPSWDVPSLAGAGGLRSKANDLLKYVSANLGLKRTRLTPLMEKTHDLGLGWYAKTDPQRIEIVMHGGGTGGHRSFVGFDKARRRGVVVLTNTKGVVDIGDLGFFLLRGEWQSNRRPTATTIAPEAYDAYVGQYRRTPGLAWQAATVLPKAAIYVVAVGLAILAIGVLLSGRVRRRGLLVCLVLLITGVALRAAIRQSSPSADGALQTEIAIRRDGNRLLAEAIGRRSWPLDVLLPPNRGELLPASKSRFFERFSGNSIRFSPAGGGNVARLTAHHGGDAFVYERVAEQPPKPAEPLKPRVAIQLDAQILEAFVGRYDFEPNAVFPAGMRAIVSREADQLLWQEQGPNAIPGAIELFAESSASFFTRIDATRLTFMQNDAGSTTAVVLHLAGSTDVTGKKVAND
jgi:CubicO group peptidase (beta-lactamase class C family)